MNSNPRQRHLRERLRRLTAGTSTGVPGDRARPAGAPVDVVITPNEVNDKHGTGSLVRRLFPRDQGLLSLRARDDFGGEHGFGEAAAVISHHDLDRAGSYRAVLDALGGRPVRRIACVPYLRDDLLTAMALHDATGAPLACWIMDDQNVAQPSIPDALMREFLEKCRLRLTTHREMRQAYEKKFGLRFWLLPAVAPAALVRAAGAVPTGPLVASRTGALVGSIWSQRWLDLLCATLGPSGLPTAWYGNDRTPFLQVSRPALAAARIEARGIVPEPALAAALREHPYAVVPTGTLDGDDGNARALAELSLPGRILFVAATSQTPVIVLGSEQTPAARFVRQFGLGVTVPYDAAAYRAAVEEVCAPEAQASRRAAAARLAPRLSSAGVTEWFWSSLEQGAAADLRFEDLQPRREDDLVPYMEAPTPGPIYREYVPIFQVLRRLHGRGFRPDFVIDVGASMGIWSHAASQVFPDARFVLVDPLASRYGREGRRYHADRIPHHDSIEAAVADRPGRTTFNVPPDLFGASLLTPADFRNYEPVEVEVTTVDEIGRRLRLQGRGLLKADVQCAEHLVVDGAQGLLPRIDAIVLELSLARYHPEARTFLELQNRLDELGFRYYDDAGCWRSPVDGTLLQKDVLFLRKELFPPVMGQGGLE